MGAEQQLLWGVGMVQEELLDDTREDGNQPERDRRRKKERKEESLGERCGPVSAKAPLVLL